MGGVVWAVVELSLVLGVCWYFAARAPKGRRLRRFVYIVVAVAAFLAIGGLGSFLDTQQKSGPVDSPSCKTVACGDALGEQAESHAVDGTYGFGASDY